MSPWKDLSVSPTVKIFIPKYQTKRTPTNRISRKSSLGPGWFPQRVLLCASYIYIINMKSSPHFWAPCVSHDASRVTRDPLTHKCPPPAGIGYLQLSSGHDVFHGFWLKPVLLHDMSVETFLRTPRTSMVQLIPFILLG